MDERFRDLLACPACRGPLASTWSCGGCGAAFGVEDGIPNLRLPADARTEEVRRFYARTPFPNYPPRDSLQALRARAGRSDFVRVLDQAIAGDARVLDVGCGTGQMSLYLARADRLVVGADLAHPSLRLAAAAADRFGLSGVQFVETDLHRPGLREGAFDVVVSLGVLHHTPDPRRSFAKLTGLARPGGIVVVGLYNAFARIPLRLRRAVARASGFRWVPFDPVLRDRRHEPERREAWLRDQYQHPEEHRHTIGEVQRWFAENGVEYLRTYPDPHEEGQRAEDGGHSPPLFTPAVDNWWPEQILAQLGWMRALGHEGGLFVAIGRRG
jgi:2-polyprenyl-3-methyl-5-hydroxy-6-metoxy-1,4-benzoquinol methylase